MHVALFQRPFIPPKHMIKFHLASLILDYEERNQRRLTLVELAEATGIARPTLSKMQSPRGGHNTTTNNVDALCKYFGCRVEDVMEYLPEE